MVFYSEALAGVFFLHPEPLRPSVVPLHEAQHQSGCIGSLPLSGDILICFSQGWLGMDRS